MREVPAFGVKLGIDGHIGTSIERLDEGTDVEVVGEAEGSGVGHAVLLTTSNRCAKRLRRGQANGG